MHGTLDLEQRPFELTPKQREGVRLLGGPQRHTCFVGGGRSGKTFMIIRAIVIRALRAAASRHLAVRFRANAIRASVWLDTYPKVMRLCFPEVRAIPHRQDGFEEFPNGSQLWFGGLDEDDRVEKILGQEYATIYAGECSQIPYSSILVMRTRLAQPGTGLKLRGIYDLNPTTTRHWTNVEFGLKRDPVTNLPLAMPDNYQRMFINPVDNARNLDPETIAEYEGMPEKYRRRFYLGEYVDEVEGALWTIDLIELCRDEPIEPTPQSLREFQRIAIGVDPSGAQSKYDTRSDEIGIVVAGRLRGDPKKPKAVVLEDGTLIGSPKEWGERVAALYKKWKADVVVGEKNFGGAMVESTIKVADPNVKVKLVSATRGKTVRAEPIASLYEERRVTHAGKFTKMEDQLCEFSTQGFMGSSSPDRADACVWALTELMLEEYSRYTLANVR